MRAWRRQDREEQLKPKSLGRPCKESSHADKVAALDVIHREGPHLGLPTLRALAPAVPRCQWIDLQRDYRWWWKANHQREQEILHWRLIGAVWAVDFSKPPEPIDGRYQRVFAARDLASGMQLAWLPVLDETAATAKAALQQLFHEHGPPLVVKSDNGSAFQSGLWKSLFQESSVTPLYSPPARPQFNGACEAGIGSMKTRTAMLADEIVHVTQWTSSQLESARRQANKIHRGDKPTNPTSWERWQERSPISSTQRDAFKKALDEQRDKVDNQVHEARLNHEMTASQLARNERKSITQALIELGILSVTRRLISLPINVKKAARIT